MPAFLQQPSFAGGELAPSLCGRVDISKYGVGLKTLENFVVHPHGGVSKRNGFRYVGDLPNRGRLVPFQYSLDDSYMLAFCPYAIYVFKNGKPVTVQSGSETEVLTIATPYSADEIDSLGFTQSADVLFIAHQNHAPQELTRYSDTNWVLSDFEYKHGPFITQDAEQAEISLTPAVHNMTGGEQYLITGSETSTKCLVSDTAYFEKKHLGMQIRLTQHVDMSMKKFTEKAVLHQESEVVYDSSSEISAAGEFFYNVTSTTKIDCDCQTDCGSDDCHYQYESEYGVKFPSDIVSGFGIGDRISYTNMSNSFVQYSVSSVRVSQGYTSFIFAVDDDNWSKSASGTYKLGHYKTTTTTGMTWGEDMEMTCYDGWTLDTTGFWGGEFYLERYDTEESRWVKMKTYTSVQSSDGQSAKNYSDTGSFDEPTKIRLRSSTSDPFTPFKPDDNEEQDMGYITVRLNECEYNWYGKIIGVIVADATVGVGELEEYVGSDGKCRKIMVKSDYDFAHSEGTKLWNLGSWGGDNGYPATVGFYQERIVFGSSKKEPQTIWFSKTGDYSDFGTSLPVVDDDAINVTLASREVSAIRHFVPLQNLLLLTSNAEWKITAGDGAGAAISPSSISAIVQGYRGISKVEPAMVGNTVLYTQAQGMRVRDLAYTFESDSYTGNDMTIMANHLFRDSPIVSMAYQQEPDSVLWCVREDGLLCSMTYQREHDVVAWARHPVDNGRVESVAVISDPDSDDVYISVVRKSLGGVEQRMVEVMDTGSCSDPVEAFYLDNGRTYRFSDADDASVIKNVKGICEIKGLYRYGDQTLDIVADGSVRKSVKIDLTPCDYMLSLSEPCSEVRLYANRKTMTYELTDAENGIFTVTDSAGKVQTCQVTDANRDDVSAVPAVLNDAGTGFLSLRGLDYCAGFSTEVAYDDERTAVTVGENMVYVLPVSYTASHDVTRITVTYSAFSEVFASTDSDSRLVKDGGGITDVKALDKYLSYRTTALVKTVEGVQKLISLKKGVNLTAQDEDYLIHLSPEAKVVHVGYGYTAKLRTLDLMMNRSDGSNLTRSVRVGEVGVKVENTRGLWAGTDDDHLIEQIDRTNESYLSPTALSTASYHITLDSRFEESGVTLCAPSPMPCSVLAVVPKVDIGG